MSESSTPVMDVMPRVIIPDMVHPLGPQFSKLPAELLIEIFKFTITFDTTTTMTTRRRDTINLVCKKFFELSNYLFYSCQTFNPSSDLFRRPFMPPTNYVFPPVAFRNLIRRLRIAIELKDHFSASGNRQFISTVQELFTHCPGARRLRDLTNGANGFCGLQHLELVVLTDYNFPGRIQETLAVLRGAAFGLRATRLYVLAVRSGGRAEQYHDEVVDAILDQ